jgi:nitrite reductase (NO-forming)
VRVSLVNSANGLVHSFVVDELNVKLENVQPKTTGDVTFTPTTAGTYVFYCDTPGHKAAGMTGTIVINP